MKKALLTLGAALLAMTASAAVQNLLPTGASNFDNGQKNGWGAWGDNAPTSAVVEPGYNSAYCLELECLTAAGSEYFKSQAGYDFTSELEEGDYIYSFYAKTDVEGGAKIQIQYAQNVSPWGGGGYTEVSLTNEWKQYSTVLNVNKEGMNRICINFGGTVGKYYFDDIVFGQEGAGDDDDDTGFKAPEGYELMYSGNQNNWNEINAWQSVFSNDTYEGRPCIKYVNAEAGDSYKYQIQVNLDYKPETMYYFTFDVIGEPSDAAISAWYQYVNEAVDPAIYEALGYNDFNSITVTSATEWTPVVLQGKYTASTKEGIGEANRVVLNVGAYAGTMYFTNFKIYGPAEEEGGDSSAVETVEVAKSPAGVYNMMGVKVANDLQGVAPGLYIVAGKKVLVSK